MQNEVKLTGLVQRSFGTRTREIEGKTWLETDFILAVKRGENNWDNILVKIKNAVKLEDNQFLGVMGALRVDSWQDKESKEWKSRSYVVTSMVIKLTKKEFKEITKDELAQKYNE